VRLTLTEEQKQEKRLLAKQANQKSTINSFQDAQRDINMFVDLHSHDLAKQRLQERKERGAVHNVHAVERSRRLVSAEEFGDVATTVSTLTFGNGLSGPDDLTTREQARAEAQRSQMPASYVERVVNPRTGRVSNMIKIVLE